MVKSVSWSNRAYFVIETKDSLTPAGYITQAEYVAAEPQAYSKADVVKAVNILRSHQRFGVLEAMLAAHNRAEAFDVLRGACTKFPVVGA